MTIMEKIKETINKLPFNGLVGKIPALAKVAGFSNYAACALGVLLVIVVVSVITPNKASAQTKSGNTDKALNGEWLDDGSDVFSFDKGEFTYFSIPGETMERGTYETDVGTFYDGEEVGVISITCNEGYNFETGKWIEKEMPVESIYAYGLSDDDTLKMMTSSGYIYTYKRGKYLKELIAKVTAKEKRIAEVKAMSVDKLKKQAPAPEEDFLVKPTDDSFTAVEIVKYKGNGDIVVIPATIQGLPVKWIGGEAFRSNYNLVAVVIPEGVTCITEGGDGAFNFCKKLSTVVLPSTLKEIDANAFRDCHSLKSIDLPAGLLYIGSDAFKSSGLTSVNLPEGLLCIQSCAFAGTSLTSVKLPKSLRLLGSSAFARCNSLTEIHIPEDHAISHWDALETTFEVFFSGEKINESIALQKLLKETKTREWNEDELILNDFEK